MLSGETVYHLNNGLIQLSLDSVGAYIVESQVEGVPLIPKARDGRGTHGGASVLIPFANRIRDAKYTYNGIVYELPKNNEGNAIHGFARNRTFQVVSQRRDSIEFESTLKDPGYPFPLNIVIIYELKGRSLSTTVRAYNLGDEKCPLMVGFHPYYNISGKWAIATSTETEVLKYSDRYFPTGFKEPYNFNSIKDLSKMSFDNCFTGGGELTLESDLHTLKITRNGFDYFVVYNGEYSWGKSVAIEPMTGAPDCFNNRLGLIELESGEKYTCSYSVSVD